MKTLLSIDPGLRGCGAAIFIDSTLARAEYVKNTADEDSNGPRTHALMAASVLDWAKTSLEGIALTIPMELRIIDQLAVEYPTTYSGRASKGDTNDLLPLAGVDAALAALLPHAEVDYKVPHDWKGGIKKPKSVKVEYPTMRRVIERLSVEERTRAIWPKNKRHGWDIADGIGVGLACLGRFERRRIYSVE